LFGHVTELLRHLFQPLRRLLGRIAAVRRGGLLGGFRRLLEGGGGSVLGRRGGLRAVLLEVTLRLLLLADGVIVLEMLRGAAQGIRFLLLAALVRRSSRILQLLLQALRVRRGFGLLAAFHLHVLLLVRLQAGLTALLFMAAYLLRETVRAHVFREGAGAVGEA